MSSNGPIELLVEAGSVGCRIRLRPDLTVAALSEAKFPDPSLRLQRAGFEDVAWYGRSKLVATARLNYSVFPAAPPEGVWDYGRAGESHREAVEVDLAEGRGFSVQGSGRYQALTFWWLQRLDKDTPEEGASFVLSERTVTNARTTTMRSLESVTSDVRTEHTIRMLALPYRILDEHADSHDMVTIDICGGAPYKEGSSSTCSASEW